MDPNRTLSAAYPAPPPYYKHYTDENLALAHEDNQAPHKDHTSPSQPTFNLDPPQPVLEPILVFGTLLDINAKIPSLESLGITQLSQSTLVKDRTSDLKKLNHSLILNFYELLEMLETEPCNAQFKIEHIRLILINFHSMLNEYRPHQARDTLAIMMREQIRRRRETTQSIRNEIDKTRALSTGLVADTDTTDATGVFE
ncbi:hypothetical protein BASA50_002040 [Batrachochytrium salamandrivorans]|uniref:Mediator of RNA polymerase II transcription subunit 7 n=1 Tax=Batrachochytrium salamandrivorans TaxID=1357716 RepID=A0ABQ8FMH4_9FUNG|nr:hypothetical protein BASA62_006512 [Batrachochytrium salamandrivorans]KAH6576241.1 hypothetical protein BASA60_004609 [Batrachochytrium salamandrivorans]KAH6585061.1 hypothetical protein BASA61_007133 [Batrachochytrium salamandrivorans]KAH6600835.1 hypothetical protein BASA50_002040 [Batrachochytrium salamandrivorans]KAH9247592.1 hypothetical protein BASA81_014809 [Batrachochytrium salamandrivorans]